MNIYNNIEEVISAGVLLPDSIVNGECIEVMKYIPDNSVDLILCDLPFALTANKLDILIPFDLLWKEYNRIGKPNCNIVLFSQGLFYVDMINSNRKNFRYDIVWNKILITGFLNAKKMPLRSHEQICVFKNSRHTSKDTPTYNPQFTEGTPLHSKGYSYMEADMVNNNYGDYNVTDDSRKGETKKYPKSIWSYQKPHPSKALHRTEKPIILLEELIKSYSNEGDVVIDNCAGSFSLAVSCDNTIRKWICIEQDKKYCEIGLDRIKKNRERLKLII